MKKWKTFLTVVLSAAVLTGCSRFQPEQSTVKIKKDGSLQTAVVESLDKSYYKEEELKAMIDDAVAAYNGNKEEAPVVVNGCEVEEGTASLYMDYASAEDYQAFNHVTFFAQDLQGAYDNGFAFPDKFQKVEKGKAAGTADKSEILSGLNYYVVIYSEKMDVEVPGNIVYASPDVTITGKRTATNRPEALQDAEDEEKEQDGQAEASVPETEEGDFEVEEGSFEPEGGETADGGLDDGQEEQTALTFIVYE